MWDGDVIDHLVYEPGFVIPKAWPFKTELDQAILKLCEEEYIDRLKKMV